MKITEQFIFSIMEKMNASEISEFDLDDGEIRLTLHKKTTCNPEKTSSSKVPFNETAATVPAAARNAHALDSGKAVSAAERSEEKIISPLVGTFYSSPGPDAPPFVYTGAVVKKGQTLCILEAMKMMNHLEAEFDCEIKEIYAKSGELVEYGQTLFTVDRL